MHENHEPTCAFCTKFILPFSQDSPLTDWGYCIAEIKGHVPTSEELKEIEEHVRKGNYSFLTKGHIPLFQALGEGCEKFEDLDDH